MKKILFIVGLVSTILLTACSSEESVVKEDGKVNAVKDITFQFTEEAYVPGKVSTDKAGAKGIYAVEPQAVDLGDGLIAEVSLEPDTMGTVQTRAPQPMSDGHYTIYAVDASNVRHDGISGTVAGGTFTPDAAKNLELNAGETYTFVCFNDAITDNGTDLQAIEGVVNPMIGTAIHTVSTSAHDVVTFEMKHLMARLRIQISSHMAPPQNLTMKLWLPSIADRNETFDIKGVHINSWSDGNEYNGPTIPFSPNKPYVYSAISQDYTTTSDYVYGSQSILGESYSFNFTGTLHGESLTNMTFPPGTYFYNNHSYLVKVKYKSKGPLYLYQDGTVGYLGDKGTRTPIGVVVKEKTTGTEGTAIALTDATTPATHQAWGKLGVSPQLLNTTQSTDFNTQLADIDGYHWTYDASGSQDGTVKANNSTLGSFYTAANYNSTTPPAFSGGRLGKWYLPSLGEWALALKSLAKVTYFPTTMEEYGGSSLPTTRGKFDWTTLNTVFTAAGGTALEDYWYWTSGEYNGQQATVVCFDGSPAQNIFHFGTDDKHYIGCCVRAFIHF